MKIFFSNKVIVSDGVTAESYQILEEDIGVAAPGMFHEIEWKRMRTARGHSVKAAPPMPDKDIREKKGSVDQGESAGSMVENTSCS